MEVKSTPWRSLYLNTGMQCVMGMQFGIYMLITWPYFMEIDSSATTTYLGFIVSANSLGAAIFNPVYGWWSQKTLSTIKPVTVGFVIAFLGNLLYILAPLFSDVKLILLLSRFIIGCGAGSITSLQAYISNASTQEDRLRANSLASGGFTAGIMLGPAVPAIFTFLPPTSLGPVLLNTYTLSAFTMMALCVICIFVLVCLFEEKHAGIMSEEEKRDLNVELPPVDISALLVCFYTYFLSMGIATAIESTQTPLTIALYDWSNEKAVRYNGIITTLSCVGDMFIYGSLSTKLGNLLTDRRRPMMVGMLAFVVFYFLHIPWPVWEYIEDNRAANASFLAENGGYTGEKCYERYTWCGSTTRLPVEMYFFIMIFFLSVSFPLIISNSNTLISEIVGPRKQGIWQGWNSFAGSMGQFVAPMASTAVFEASGYLWMTVVPFCMAVFCILLYIVFYKRLVPLKIIYKDEKPPLALDDIGEIQDVEK